MKNRSLIMANFVSKTFGWKVFPVNPKNKQPLIKGWQKRASNQKEELTSLFSKYPYSMIGLPTGPINGVSVIDFDLKNNINGLSNFLQKGFTVSFTSCVETPSGGFHLYFKTGNVELPNNASTVLGQGVDFRGTGGYVVCPPSISETGEYIWSKRWANPKKGIKELPSYLIKILREKPRFKSKFKKINFNSNILDPIYEGQRDTELTRRCGFLFKKTNLENVLNFLLQINHKCCHPPLPDKQVYKIFNSIRKREGI